MKYQKQFFWFVWVAIGCVAIVFFQVEKKTPQTVRLTLGETQYQLEIAASKKTQALGLGHRESICSTCGMIFVFSEKSNHIFWMRGMRFNLDFLWLDDNRVVYKHEDIPFESQDLLSATEPTNRVIELPSGAAKDVQVGDELDLQY